jgi:hypothetical protein
LSAQSDPNHTFFDDLPMVTGRFIENVTFFDDLAWFGHDLGIF